MPMQVVVGNLVQMALAGEVDVIAHGCNCFCQMGRGIALEVKNTFPQAYEVDLETTPGERLKLGTCTFAEHWVDDRVVHIVNAYTQYHWSEPKGEVLVIYDAVRRCMKEIRRRFAGKLIGFPLIGAGLARGEWGVIERIILEELGEEDVTIVHFSDR